MKLWILLSNKILRKKCFFLKKDPSLKKGLTRLTFRLTQLEISTSHVQVDLCFKNIQKLRSCLVTVFKQQKLLFKHHNTCFHILFHLYVFSQNLNNISKNLLPNKSLGFGPIFLFRFKQVKESRSNFATFTFSKLL